MKFAMCNEFCQKWPLADCLALAAKCGYDGIELAPFTLAAKVGDLDAAARRQIRADAARHQLAVVGIHWLLVSPAGLYLNHPDRELRERTRAYFAELIHFCADVGGDRMVIGSPKQRNVVPGQTYQATWDRTVEALRALAPIAGERGVFLCVEPLARTETNFLTSTPEALRLLAAVGHPNVKLTLDCKAMSDEGRPLPDLIREAGPAIGHFHANDPNLGYPGSGTLDFRPVLAALREINYPHWVSIEVFDFKPAPEKIAGDGLACLRASLTS